MSADVRQPYKDEMPSEKRSRAESQNKLHQEANGDDSKAFEAPVLSEKAKRKRKKAKEESSSEQNNGTTSIKISQENSGSNGNQVDLVFDFIQTSSDFPPNVLQEFGELFLNRIIDMNARKAVVTNPQVSCFHDNNY